LKTRGSQIFFDAIVEEAQVADSDDIRSPLGPSRSYTLSLNPQIVYAQSRFLPALVSSQIHSQLEFLAVGSWWVCHDGRLQKIPSTREDVFNDESLSMGAKRSLMKFLRYVLQEDSRNESGSEAPSKETLKEALKDRYKLPLGLEAPMVALALSPAPAAAMNALEATARIQRHMQSVGYFGPGFGAVIAKYSGNAEIAQVACRAQAVGGGVYLLGHGLVDISELASDGEEDDIAHPEPLLKVKFSDGTEVRTRWVVGGSDDIPTSNQPSSERNATSQVETLHSIDIISDPLKHLFPPTSETGPVPAAVIVLVEDEADACPLYLQIHSEDTGECRAGQCKFSISLHDFASKDEQI
jgi:Rab proteins geranylgeranyltransferase component A